MEEIKHKVTEHEYAIKNISHSIESLVIASKESNDKLDQVVNSIANQDVILEKMTNLEENTKESITRVHQRIDTIEAITKDYVSTREHEGCPALQVAQKTDEIERTKLIDNVASNQKRINSLDDTVVWISRSIIGALITGAMGLLFYMLDQR